MSLFLGLPPKRVQRTAGLSTTRGWIGLDIASHSIRFAQVEQREGRYHFASRWLCPLQADASALPSELLTSSVSSLAKIRKMFGRSQCAATLPQSLATLRSFELPQVGPSEMREMVLQELAADNEVDQEDSSVGFWNWESHGSDMTNVTALSVSKQIATRVVQDLLRCGFDCQVLDGLPCALARAAAIASDSMEPAAILDLSDTSMTIVVAAAEKPVFTRVLRGGGLYSLLTPLRDKLQLTYQQSMQVLSYTPMSPREEQSNPVSDFALHLIENPLGHLVDELDRTLTYVSQQYCAYKPSCLWLVGDGTAIQCLLKYLSSKLSLPVELWRLPGTRMMSDDARYGVAAALSVLRWEPSSCT